MHRRMIICGAFVTCLRWTDKIWLHNKLANRKSDTTLTGPFRAQVWVCNANAFDRFTQSRRGLINLGF